MKQLTVFEMEAISGGTFDLGDVAQTAMDAAMFCAQEVGAMALGASLGAMYGSIVGGRWGGAGGGVLGFGAIGQGVGMVWGLVVGGIGFAVAAGIVGWDVTFKYAKQAVESTMDGTLVPWN